MSKISFWAVLIGAIVDVGGSSLSGLLFLIFYVFPRYQLATLLASLPLSEQTQQLHTIFTQDPYAVLFSWTIGGAFSILGGYVAARLAKTSLLLNGALASFLCVFFALFSIGSTSLLNVAIGVLINPLLALFGAYIFVKTNKAAQKKISDSKAGIMPNTNEPSTERLSIWIFFSNGWKIFKKRPYFLICVVLLLSLGSFAIGILTQLLLVGSALLGNPFAILVVSLAVFVVSISGQSLFGFFMVAFSLKAHDYLGALKIRDVFKIKSFWNYWGANILYYTSIAIGTLLFIVPGIIAGATFAFAPYIAVDRGLNPIDAMKESARITRGNRWRVLILQFSISFLYLLGALALIVGIFAAFPIGKLAYANAYRRFTTDADKNVSRSPLRTSEKLVVAFSLSLIVAFFTLFGLVVAGFFTPKAILIHTINLQPVSSLVPLNATRVPFTTFSISNNTSKSVTLSGFHVQASSSNNSVGIKQLVLLDVNGMEVGPVVNLDPSNGATLGGDYVLLPHDSETLTIVGNAGDCEHACANDGESVEIGLTGILSPAEPPVVGTLPIIGSTQIMNSHLQIGTVIAESNQKQNAVQGIVSNQDVRFIDSQFKVGPQEDLTLKSIRYKYTGSLNFNEVSNVQATVAGKNYPAMTGLAVNGPYMTVSFGDGIPFTEGSSLDVTLHGMANTLQGQGKTIEFEIENPSDVYFVGQTYGYGVAPVSGNGSINWQMGQVFQIVK